MVAIADRRRPDGLDVVGLKVHVLSQIAPD